MRTSYDVSFNLDFDENSGCPNQTVRVNATVSPSYFDGWDVENVTVLDDEGNDVTDDLLYVDFNEIGAAALDYRQGEEEDARERDEEMRREDDD